MDSGCPTGGILKLRELIEEHPAEVAYDFRHFFHLSIEDIGESVTWREATLLTYMLLQQPNSWLQAAFRNWKRPVSPEWILLADQLDAFVMANSKNKPKPYPRPWSSENTKKIGRSQDNTKVLSRLEAMNPKDRNGS